MEKHAFDNRADEFSELGVNNIEQFKDCIDEKLNDPSIECFSAFQTSQTWREADIFYHEKDNVMIIVPEDPNSEPTAYRPPDGRTAFEDKLIESSKAEKREINVVQGLDALSEEKDNVNAGYFANSVVDSEKFPPKEGMGDLVQERKEYEESDAILRVANGGSAELSESEEKDQNLERMQTYVAAQKTHTME